MPQACWQHLNWKTMLLRDKDKERLLLIFDQVGIRFEVWAYGSRVNGTAHSGSDLDLVIRQEGLRALPEEKIRRIREQIGDSHIPILVELRDWADIPDSFRVRIEANHELLYSNLV